jgi:Holliday junction resolvase RusA-like endonuclease
MSQKTEELVLEISGLPPSTNQLYSNFHGKRVLSAGGKRYKRKIAMQVAQEFPAAGPFTNADPFSLKIVLHFDIHTRTKGAKNRYKKFDVSNRVKVLEDALCESFGIDDRQVLRLEIEKCPTEGPERTAVTLRKLQRSTRLQSLGKSASTTDSE